MRKFQRKMERTTRVCLYLTALIINGPQDIPANPLISEKSEKSERKLCTGTILDRVSI